MRMKMADVARYLGVSKATVSLAVNGKPGVSDQTRQKILQCIGEMEKNNGRMPKAAAAVHPHSFQIIKVVIINHRKQVVCDPELDLWSDVLRTFDVEARKRGYLYGLTYLNDTEDDVQAIIDECNLDLVAGVILYGTEMEAADYGMIRRIHKPLVVYDYEMPDGAYSSICIDNRKAVELSLQALNRAGALDICYVGTGKDIYNFRKRREAYREIVSRGELFPRKDNIVILGNTISEITEQAAAYLNAHKLPAAFLMENYQVSIGILAAIRKLGIAVPGSLKLVGIDEVSDYIVPELKLTHIRIPHVERAAIAMSILDREILGFWQTKVRVFTVPEFVKGESV